MQTTGKSSCQLFDAYCSFCEGIYGGLHYTKINPVGYETLYIENGHDHFKVCLADKTRFEKYDLFHRNWGARLGGAYDWHKQGSFFTLGFAIFMAYSPEVGKTTRIPTKYKDYERFLADFHRSLYEN